MMFYSLIHVFPIIIMLQNGSICDKMRINNKLSHNAKMLFVKLGIGENTVTEVLPKIFQALNCDVSGIM